MNGLELATPLALALLPAPLALRILLGARAAPGGGLPLPATIRQRLGADASPNRLRLPWRAVAGALAWVCLVLALAGPRIAGAVAALPAAGRDIMLALDLSGSMTKTDFELDGVAASRLAVLKHFGAELIHRRAGDRVGLVVFAETAFAAAPSSFDLRAVSATLESMEIGLVGRSTAIGEGLGLALKRLSDSTAPSRLVILLSDGANNAGSSEPAAVAELARGMGVTLFTIGLGVDDTSSKPDDPDAVDFAALQHIAEIGGGAAFRARTGAELEAATRAIEALIAGPAPAPPTVIFRELWIYPGALAFCAAMALALSTRERR
ncbi:MAG TPA: VWA domain-containing protein [Methylosinus sp.]|jgi:Ca-activated chloride channel family protein|uniref:VWA domain-containing protein n=1 Tax=Methylosinus sp. TaxID=427 RepID=UPI002F95F2CE